VAPGPPKAVQAARIGLVKVHLAALRQRVGRAPVPPPARVPDADPDEAGEAEAVTAWPVEAGEAGKADDWPADAERRLGYRFGDRSLLRQALTHSSHSQVYGVHNERMEFFGDAVLDLVVREHLFHQFPDRREGDLTEIKSAMVRGGALAKAARRMGLDRFLRVGHGARGRKPKVSDSMLGDAFEALVAAVYLDGGYGPARQLILRTVAGDLAESAGEAARSNHKSLLQQQAQQRWRTTPGYRVVSQEGPGHARLFTVAVSVEGRDLGQGRGHSKKEAEQAAARAALDALGKP